MGMQKQKQKPPTRLIQAPLLTTCLIGPSERRAE
jgi:hypothetical protein